MGGTGKRNVRKKRMQRSSQSTFADSLRIANHLRLVAFCSRKMRAKVPSGIMEMTLNCWRKSHFLRLIPLPPLLRENTDDLSLNLWSLIGRCSVMNIMNIMHIKPTRENTVLVGLSYHRAILWVDCLVSVSNSFVLFIFFFFESKQGRASSYSMRF